MISRAKAHALRALIVKASASLTDEDALDGIELFPLWAAGIEYAVDVRVRYEDKLYRCVQAHTSQEGWEPPAVPALWTEVAKPGEIPVWKQPTGAQDAYMKDDLVRYPDAESELYISLYDNNTWEPTYFGWELIPE